MTHYGVYIIGLLASVMNFSEGTYHVKNPCRTSALPHTIKPHPYLYYPYPGDKRLFIQCDAEGKAFLKICPDGLDWDQTQLTCAKNGAGGHDHGSKGHKEVKREDGREATIQEVKQEVPHTVHDHVQRATDPAAGHHGHGVVSQQNARNSPPSVSVHVSAPSSQPAYPGYPVQAAQYATLGVLPASPFLNLILMSAGNQIAAVSNEGMAVPQNLQVPAQNAAAAQVAAPGAGNEVTAAVGAKNPCPGSDARFHPFAANPTQYLECKVKHEVFLWSCGKNQLWSQSLQGCVETKDINNSGREAQAQAIANPCSKEAVSYYHILPGKPGHFIQCDQFGNMFPQPCGPHKVWEDLFKTCVGDGTSESVQNAEGRQAPPEYDSYDYQDPEPQNQPRPVNPQAQLSYDEAPMMTPEPANIESAPGPVYKDEKERSENCREGWGWNSMIQMCLPGGFEGFGNEKSQDVKLNDQRQAQIPLPPTVAPATSNTRDKQDDRCPTDYDYMESHFMCVKHDENGKPIHAVEAKQSLSHGSPLANSRKECNGKMNWNPMLNMCVPPGYMGANLGDMRKRSLQDQQLGSSRQARHIDYEEKLAAALIDAAQDYQEPDYYPDYEDTQPDYPDYEDTLYDSDYPDNTQEYASEKQPPLNSLFTYDSNNPCQNGDALFYPHSTDSRSYIQCDELGQMHVQVCSKGKTWNQKLATCTPDLDDLKKNPDQQLKEEENKGENPCIGEYVYTHQALKGDDSRFIMCSGEVPYIMHCPPGAVWNDDIATCYPKYKKAPK